MHNDLGTLAKSDHIPHRLHISLILLVEVPVMRENDGVVQVSMSLHVLLIHFFIHTMFWHKTDNSFIQVKLVSICANTFVMTRTPSSLHRWLNYCVLCALFLFTDLVQHCLPWLTPVDHNHMVVQLCELLTSFFVHVVLMHACPRGHSCRCGGRVRNARPGSYGLWAILHWMPLHLFNAYHCVRCFINNEGIK